MRQVNFGGAYLEGAMMPAIDAQRVAFQKMLTQERKEAKEAQDSQQKKGTGVRYDDRGGGKTGPEIKAALKGRAGQ